MLKLSQLLSITVRQSLLSITYTYPISYAKSSNIEIQSELQLEEITIIYRYKVPKPQAHIPTLFADCHEVLTTNSLDKLSGMSARPLKKLTSTCTYVPSYNVHYVVYQYTSTPGQ